MMKVTGKKNLEEGEVVVYHPAVHGIVLLKPFLLLAGSVVLFIVWFVFLRKNTADFLSPLSAGILDEILDRILIVNMLVWIFFSAGKVLEYLTVEYYLTNKRLIFKRGVLSTLLIDMPIEKIESLYCLQSIGGNLFNYGTIVVSGIGGTRPRLKTVRKPHAVRRKIYDVLEKNRKVTVIREENPKPDGKRETVVRAADYGIFVTSYPGEKKIK